MISLRNHLSEERDGDRLYKRASYSKTRTCPANTCLGSTYGNGGSRNEVTPDARSPEEVKTQATEFLTDYYASIQRSNSAEHKARLEQVLNEIDKSLGTYELTEAELIFGTKLAWRNAPRCVGRIQWKNLKIFDARKVITAKEMFEAICNHIIYTTNGGNIRSTITVFPMRKHGKPDFRIWNPFIIGYAGYRNPDGSILGHSINVELTELCLKLGWKSKRTKHDILPLLLSANGADPELFVIPPEIVMEVQLTHPEYDWFKELDIRWFTIPLLSAMLFDCGGLQFPAAPFNGWFTAPEIASRDLGDVNKYNYLKEVAQQMGLSTESSTSLWKDKAMVELNISVLYSFQKAGVTIIDHHTAAEQFMKHLENEKRERGGCPADWVWIVPPISGSTVPTFHQEMALYFLKPSYEYQPAAWKVHKWKDPALNPFSGHLGSCTAKKFTLKQVGLAVLLSSSLFKSRLLKRIEVSIIYATETGKSETFARRLGNIFKNSFNVKVQRMDLFDVSNLHNDSLILVITSTFGNGDPPVNGEQFYEYISKMKSVRASTSDSKPEDPGKMYPLQKMRFAVFALGSSAYPNVCAFGRNLDYSFNLLGGQQLIDVPCGDELSGQEKTFRKWTHTVYRAACETYSINFSLENAKEESLFDKQNFLSAKNIRFQNSSFFCSDIEAYRKLHRGDMKKYVVKLRQDLHEVMEDAQTIQIVLECPPNVEPHEYRVGDHIGILPKNRAELVDLLLKRLENKPLSDDRPVQLQLQSNSGWQNHEKLLPTSLREILTSSLDITSPPSPKILAYLSTIAKNEEKSFLKTLVDDDIAYEEWKEKNWADLLTVLELFPSCSADAAVICSLLPVLQPRFYSVSSSSKVFPKELHLTAGVVKYSTETGKVNLGVCSNYLNEIQIGSLVTCFVRNTNSTTFRMPSDQSRPIIMIGPGTGMAPFRGFWQERKLLREQGALSGKMSLFVGCRDPKMVLYNSELKEMQSAKILTNVFKAYSRVPNMQKTYVQDLIRSNAKELARQIMLEDAVIYVCGDVAMAENVFQTFRSIIQREEDMEDDKGKNFMRYLKESDRYHMDIFGQMHKKTVEHQDR